MKNCWLLGLIILFASTGKTAELSILLPLGRTVYQTNELITISVVRSDTQQLNAGELNLRLNGPSGSQLQFTFPVKSVLLQGARARAVEHLQLNGWLLRPGSYSLLAECDGAQAQASIEVCSHVRKSTFRIIDWGTDIKPADLLGMGEKSLGFNLILGTNNNGDNAIRAGMDYMKCCSMGGGHTLDLRKECDWSDPYVVQGASARVTAQALADRTSPNTIGVHFYDEQGLISQLDPVTGKTTPHNVAIHQQVFRSAFGIDPPNYSAINQANPTDVDNWQRWGRFKELLLESAWKRPAYGVHRTDADFITVNQSIWAWDSYTSGHYFNEVRGLDALFGHGKYSWANVAGFYLPPMTWEFGRARNTAKDSWHLPGWYSEQSDLFRQEQYMSFQLHLTGIAKPPWLHAHRPKGYDPNDEWCSIQRLFPDITDGIVESNKRMAQLGTIFTTMSAFRPPAAVLYSLSNNLHYQTAHMDDTRSGGGHIESLSNLYLASKMAHINLSPVVEEDVLDGSLAAHHQLVILTGISYLDPKVIAALNAFTLGGGKVMLTDDCTVMITGASKLGVPGRYDKTPLEMIPASYRKMAEPLQQCSYLVEPLRKATAGAGILPMIECDNPEIFISQQGRGDIEYFFATNATWDADVAEPTSIRAAQATLSMPDDGRPIYDAVLTREASEFQTRNRMRQAAFRFGAGQMRVFARTARPIEGVDIQPPLIDKNYLATKNPIQLTISATLVDTTRQILAGSAPLRVTLSDPLGDVRFDLYRATERGMLKLVLPLAANDPAGKWTISVAELLSGKKSTAFFNYQPALQCGAAIGAVNGAITFGDDYQKAFEFFATHKEVSVVAGTSDYSQGAVQRLQQVLAPMDIQCTLIPLEEAAKSRILSEQEAKTWCGLMYAGSGAIKPGGANSPDQVGFNLRGPVLLLGNPEDNPLIKFALKNRLLPFTPSKDSFPGDNRGFLAWQRDAVSYGEESLTLIAYDEKGMTEAIGTLFSAAAGITPLMPLESPLLATVTSPTTKAAIKVSPSEQWQVLLPDRVKATKLLPGGDVVMLTEDGSLLRVKASGAIVWKQTIAGGQYWVLDISADGNTIVVGATQRVLAYDANGKEKFATAVSKSGPKSARIACIAVAPDGSKIFVSTANMLFDGFPQGGEDRPWRSLLLSAKGEVVWQFGDVFKKDATPAAIYRSAFFTRDGSRIVAMNRTDYFAVDGKKPGEYIADILDVQDGKVLAKVDKVNGWLGVTPVGDQVMLLDGDASVFFVSPSEGTVKSKLTFPERGVIAAVPFGDGIVAGNEVGGHVWAVKYRSGNAQDNLAWQHAEPGLLVKKIVVNANRVAVSYWGGTLQVFDSNGVIVAEQTFQQDIADLIWSGNTLVVADADGRVMGLSIK